MDFSEYFLNLFPKGVKKAIIYMAKFLAWLDVTAFFGGLVIAFIGWYFFNNEIMVALGLGSFVASIFAIIPFMMMYASAEYIDFKDQLRDLLEKERKASESRFKLTPSDQAKLVKLKERQREIAALEAKRNRKHTGTSGCVVSILFWALMIGFIGNCIDSFLVIMLCWAIIFCLIVVAAMYMRSGYADSNNIQSQVAQTTYVSPLSQEPIRLSTNRAQNNFTGQHYADSQNGNATTDLYTNNDDAQY